MPKKSEWGRGGVSKTVKRFDFELPGLGRFQKSSGAKNKILFDTRASAIKEAWGMGGVWADAVRAVHLGRFDVSAFHAAKLEGVKAIELLLKEAGSARLRTLIDEYHEKSTLADKDNVLAKLNRFHDWLGDQPTIKAPSVAHVTAARVEEFLGQLVDFRTIPKEKNPKRRDNRWPNRKEPVPAKGSTKNRYRSAISGLFTWAFKTGRVATHPISKKTTKALEPSHRLPEMSADEYRDYMACVIELRPDLAILFLLLIHTGCDIGELWKLQTRDVNLEKRQIRYEREKTARYGPLPRFVPLPSFVVEELRAHIAEHGVRGSELMFEMLSRTDAEYVHFKRARKVIGQNKLTMKDLRHIAAIAWVKSGTNIRLVQKWLGHRSLAMTMKYTDYEPDNAAAMAMAERASETLRSTVDITPIASRRRAMGGGKGE